MVAGRAALGQAGRGARRAFHAALRLRLRPARLRHDAAALEGGHLPTGRSALGYSFVGIGVGLAGTPASHSLTGSVPVTRVGHGVGHGRPAARPGRRDHAVDLRRAADGRLRGRGGTPIAASAARTSRAARPDRADEVVLQRGRHRARGTRRTSRTTSSRGAKTSFLQGDQWAYLAGHRRRPAGRRARLLHVPEARRREAAARLVRSRGLAGRARRSDHMNILSPAEPGTDRSRLDRTAPEEAT